MKLSSRQWSVFTKILFFIRFCITLFALCVSVEAQQPKVAKIGLLRGSFREREENIEMLRRERISTFGYVDGKNIAFEFRAGTINLTVSPRWLTGDARIELNSPSTQSSVASD